MSLDVGIPMILAAALMQQILGAFWYTVVIKCASYLRLKAQPPARAARVHLVSAACSVVAAFALSVVVSSMDLTSFSTGALAGLLVGIGFVGSATLMNATYEERSQTDAWIFVTYQVVALTVAGGFLASTR